MKNQTIPFKAMLILAGLLVLSGCGQDDETPMKHAKKFVVDKIYDSNHNLVAEYFYDNDNNLIKKSVTERLRQPEPPEWAAYTDEFEYQHGRVSKIIRKDVSYDEFNHETHVIYNDEGKIIRTEVYKEGQQLSSKSDYRYKDGLLIGIMNYRLGTMTYTDTILYNRSGNVTKYIYETPEQTLIGPILGTKKTHTETFVYDHHPKPNFNLDYLFIYDPLPFLSEAQLQRLLSVNNMTEARGTQWKYTYNEHGLPATIEVKWKDGESTMLLRITYKEIKRKGGS